MLDASRFPAGFAPCRQEGVRISATTVSHSPRHRPPPSQPPSISFVYPLCSLTFHIQFHPPHSLTSSAQACYPHPPPSYRPSWAWRPYLGLHHVHALVTDVLQGGGHVDLLGALRHAVQNHVHQAVGPAPSASVTAAVTPLLSQCASLTVITSTSVTPLLSQCAALTVITSTSVSPLLSQCATLTVITSTSVNPLLSQCATLTVITSTSVTPLLSQSASRQSAPQSMCNPHRHHVKVSQSAPQSMCNPHRHHVNVSQSAPQSMYNPHRYHINVSPPAPHSSQSSRHYTSMSDIYRLRPNVGQQHHNLDVIIKKQHHVFTPTSVSNIKILTSLISNIMF